MVFERPDIVLSRPSAARAAKHYEGLLSDGGPFKNHIDSTKSRYLYYCQFFKSPVYRGGRILIHCLSLLPADAGNNGIILPTQLLTGPYRLWADLFTRINGLVNGPGNWQ